MSIKAILCVNTFPHTHAEETATRKQYVGSDMTNSLCMLPMWRLLHHEPEPYIRTTATNGDYDATAETPTAATATTARGADENDDDPDTQINMNM